MPATARDAAAFPIAPMGRSYNVAMNASFPLPDSFLFYDRAASSFRLVRNTAVATADGNDARGNRSRG